MKEVMTEMMQANKTAVHKGILRDWKPSHKPFFDKECLEAWKNLNDLASKQGFDLDSNVGDFKKFKKKNKLDCSKYFKLLTSKREAYDVKKIIKEERKASNKANMEMKENVIDAVEPPPNKKIKFEEEEEEKPVAEKINKPKKAKKAKAKSDDNLEDKDMKSLEEEVVENNVTEKVKKSKKAKKAKSDNNPEEKDMKLLEEEVVENNVTEKVKKSKKAKKAKKVMEEE